MPFVEVGRNAQAKAACGDDLNRSGRHAGRRDVHWDQFALDPASSPHGSLGFVLPLAQGLVELPGRKTVRAREGRSALAAASELVQEG